MSEQQVSRLERVEKIANILLPIIVAVVGGTYTIMKDKSDNATREQAERRDTAQKQYANLTALLPCW